MTTAIRKTPASNGIFHYVEAINLASYPSVDWEHTPDVTTVTAAGVSRNYWKYDGTNIIIEMTQTEQDNVDLLLLGIAAVDTSTDTQIYCYFETFTGNEVKQITLPIDLNDTVVFISNPSTLELGSETLLSAAGSGPVGWDPGNRGTLEASINDGNLGNLVYNNSTVGNTPGYIIGIDMINPTTINSMRFLDHSTAYFNTSWEFIGSNDADASTYDVITSGTSTTPHNVVMFSQLFADQTYRYYGIRCVTSNNPSFAILREIELSSGTIQTVEKELKPFEDYSVSKLNNSTFEITNLSSTPGDFKIVIMGKQ